MLRINSNATGNKKEIKEPSNVAMPRETITPLRNIGLRLIRNGPSVTNSVGVWRKSMVVLLLRKLATDQPFKANPARMKRTPKYVYGGSMTL